MCARDMIAWSWMMLLQHGMGWDGMGSHEARLSGQEWDRWVPHAEDSYHI